ncbi:hypothetical protein ACS0TY_024439 [Phlomoides rotata]
MPGYRITLFASISWNIWKARNRFCFDQEVQNPAQIVNWSLSLATKVPQQKPRQKRGAPGSISGAQWEPPPQGELKLNCDAGVFSDGFVGFGFIVRNEAGNPVLAGAKQRSVAAENSTTIEALALRFGLINVCSRGLRVDLVEL